LTDLSVIYWSMFQYKSPEHKNDISLLFVPLLYFWSFVWTMVLFFLRNVGLIIQICRGIFLLNCSMYQAISEIESKSNKASLFKFWFSQHCWYSCHYVQLRGLNINFKHKNGKKNIQWRHKPHIFLNSQCCWQNSMILSTYHLIFPISAF
jgi:hypothetical protein